jgi:hypothetical protein
MTFLGQKVYILVLYPFKDLLYAQVQKYGPLLNAWKGKEITIPKKCLGNIALTFGISR